MGQSVLLTHFPLRVSEAADGTIQIVQGLRDPDDPEASVSITISKSQAAELARLLKKAVGKAAGSRTAKAPSKHFDEFWQMYPSTRRFNRSGIAARWASDNLDAEWPMIRAHLQHQIASTDWRKEGGRYVPLVSTYINQRRWEAYEGQQGLRVDV